MNNQKRKKQITQIGKECTESFLKDIDYKKGFIYSQRIWNKSVIEIYKKLTTKEDHSRQKHQNLFRFECLFDDIFKALDSLYNSEKDLLIQSSQERALTTQLVYYLRHNFQKYKVDSEYTKHIEQEKLITPNAKGAERPDIIVHRRKTDKENLLAFELKHKKPFKKEDYEKLELLTKQDGDYKYKIGLAIRLDNEENFIELFVDGENVTKNPI